MAGHGQGHGQGKGHGQDMGHQEDTTGWRRDDVPDTSDDSVLGDKSVPGDDSAMPDDEHGKSADSPGHRKRDAGVQSARDFAPGRQRRG